MIALWIFLWVSLASVLAITTHLESGAIKAFKVGGLRFLRVGRIQVSACIVKGGR